MDNSIPFHTLTKKFIRVPKELQSLRIPSLISIKMFKITCIKSIIDSSLDSNHGESLSPSKTFESSLLPVLASDKNKNLSSSETSKDSIYSSYPSSNTPSLVSTHGELDSLFDLNDGKTLSSFSRPLSLQKRIISSLFWDKNKFWHIIFRKVHTI